MTSQMVVEFPPEPRRREALDALYALGYDLYAQGHTGEAADVFRALIALAPTDERGFVGLGQCHETMRQPAVAREIYGVGRVIARNAGRCEVALSRLFTASHEDDEARLALARALGIAEATRDDALRALVHQLGGVR